jgi:hypothetical protein
MFVYGCGTYCLSAIYPTLPDSKRILSESKQQKTESGFFTTPSLHRRLTTNKIDSEKKFMFNFNF